MLWPSFGRFIYALSVMDTGILPNIERPTGQPETTSLPTQHQLIILQDSQPSNLKANAIRHSQT